MKWLSGWFGKTKKPANQSVSSLGKDPLSPSGIGPSLAIAPLSTPPLPDPELILIQQLETRQKQFQTDGAWRHSPSALLQLMGLDGSLAKRKNLAALMGYQGDLDGSAMMNQWLYKAMWTRMRQNPDTIPELFRD